MSEGGDSFVPAPPVEIAPPKPLAARAEPFADAAMTNGAAPVAEARRGPTLFERVTRAGPARAEPAAAVAPAPVSDAADSLTLPKVDDDYLDPFGAR